MKSLFLGWYAEPSTSDSPFEASVLSDLFLHLHPHSRHYLRLAGTFVSEHAESVPPCLSYNFRVFILLSKIIRNLEGFLAPLPGPAPPFCLEVFDDESPHIRHNGGAALPGTLC